MSDNSNDNTLLGSKTEAQAPTLEQLAAQVAQLTAALSASSSPIVGEAKKHDDVFAQWEQKLNCKLQDTITSIIDNVDLENAPRNWRRQATTKVRNAVSTHRRLTRSLDRIEL